MFRISTLKAALLVLAATMLGWTSAAQAQTTTCGIVGSASAAPTVYDPFNPTGLTTTTVTVNLTRVNNSGGGDTRVVNFYLKANPSMGTALDGASIVPLSVSGSVLYEGIGLDIFYDFNQFPPTVLPTTLSPSGANQFMKINFTGNNTASNTAAVTFQVSLPANLNINASTVLAFDAFFGCNVQGGGSNGVQQSGSFPNAVSFPITVLSALQASFVGTALDFGEVGDVTNALATTRNTGTSNYIRVQSSGAYQVTLTSQNAYRLKHPTGSLAVPTQRINYSLKFLGATRSDTATSTISQNCARAGIGAGNEDKLYLTATLVEGGAGKDPSLSGNYSDILTVTITPQDIGVTYPTDCTAFTVP
jgi:hypothetical protein